MYSLAGTMRNVAPVLFKFFLVLTCYVTIVCAQYILYFIESETLLNTLSYVSEIKN